MTPAESLPPPWLAIARRDLGNPESLGPNDSPYLRKLLGRLNVAWLKGQPWCGIAVAGWMERAGVDYPKAYYRAKAWLDWGTPLAQPKLGCVVVFERTGGGHVGLVVGFDTGRNALIVLGGNQGDRISELPFDARPVSAGGRMLGYRWPTFTNGSVARVPPPFMVSTKDFSHNEA